MKYEVGDLLSQEQGRAGYIYKAYFINGSTAVWNTEKHLTEKCKLLSDIFRHKECRKLTENISYD